MRWGAGDLLCALSKLMSQALSDHRLKLGRDNALLTTLSVRVSEHVTLLRISCSIKPVLNELGPMAFIIVEAQLAF